MDAPDQSHSSETMTAYYQSRAREYEAIYDKPERQDDIAALKRWLAHRTSGARVLEVACGTGYWTAVAAPVASAILATDINSAPLDIARAKSLGAHVTFQQADAYDLPTSQQPCDVAMAHFWWSHVLIADQNRFLQHVSERLGKGARLLMIDNRYVAGSSTPIARQDADGNCYQLRRLSDGSTYEVLKNFPSPDDVRRALGTVATTVEVTEFDYFWAVEATLA